MIIALTDRQKKLVLCLLDQSGYTTAHTLSNVLDISEKCVRNDLNIVSAYLTGQNIHLKKEPSKGILLVATDADRIRLCGQLSQMSSSTMSRMNRLQVAALLLLYRERMTYLEIADHCMVSKLTIVRDAPLLTRLFIEAGLELSGKSGQGLIVVGPEECRRNLYLQILRDTLACNDWIPTLLSALGMTPYIEKADTLLQDIETELGVVYLERQFLVLAIAGNLSRALQQHLLDGPPTAHAEVTDYFEFTVVKNILRYYGVPGKDEAIFITGLLLQAKINPLNRELSAVTANNQNPSAIAIANYILEEIREVFQLSPQIDDKKTFAKLFNALYLHLKVALFRIRKNVPVKNELLEQIKVTIPLVYGLTKQIVAKCEKRYDLQFEEDETAFIAMHIATIYEIKVGMQYSIEILILCNFGLATSNVLQTRLLKLLPSCTISGPLSTAEGMRYIKEHDVDLIISTSKLPDNTASIVVNPLLFDDDVEKINMFVAKKYYEKQCAFFIRAYTEHVISNDTVCIRDIVALSDIQIVARCQDWESAIYLAAKPLLDRKDIEDRYVSTIIRTVKSLGNYMLLLPEIAFVHAGTDDGINRSCTSILLMREPVLFGVKKQQYVRCIVLLGINDRFDNSLLRIIPVFESMVNRLALQSPDITAETIYNMHS